MAFRYVAILMAVLSIILVLLLCKKLFPCPCTVFGPSAYTCRDPLCREVYSLGSAGGSNLHPVCALSFRKWLSINLAVLHERLRKKLSTLWLMKHLAMIQRVAEERIQMFVPILLNNPAMSSIGFFVFSWVAAGFLIMIIARF